MNHWCRTLTHSVTNLSFKTGILCADSYFLPMMPFISMLPNTYKNFLENIKINRNIGKKWVTVLESRPINPESATGSIL